MENALKKYLAIEIGGTKLQLGIGDGRGTTLTELVRADVDVAEGANGIVRAIEKQGRALLARHSIAAVGVGFGGPVDIATGVVTKSHQIEGWDLFPLKARLEKAFGCRVLVDNDCNVAALGEAKLGAGQGRGRVFYVTVGTGIGGGFVVDGKLDGNHRPAISEIGHLRPGLDAKASHQTVESVASGWGIAASTQQLLAEEDSSRCERLLALCDGDPTKLATKHIGIAAGEGDALAVAAYDRATKCLGWAIAQVITLLAPEVIVVGGGVSLVGAPFFQPLKRYVNAYVFSPLSDTFSIVPAALGEEVVVHGALQLACDFDT